jgi:TolB-like protein
MHSGHEPSGAAGTARQIRTETDGAPDAESVRAQLERILSHPLYDSSPRRRRMLRYLVEETLAGRADQLKGFGIALAVFDRDESFDPQADPVVRIEARRLRSDLDGYYAGPGHEDPLRISIPKGSYAALAYWQDSRPAPTPPASNGRAEPPSGEVPFDHPLPAESRPGPTGGTRTVLSMARKDAFLALSVLLLAGIAALWFWQWQKTSAVTSVQLQALPVIVLPFGESGDNSDDAFLAEAMTQELIADLMQFSGLRLYTANASYGQDPMMDSTALGKELGVGYLVRGSLTIEGGRLRVLADLENATTGEVIWSKTYDIEADPHDLLVVRSEVVADIATRLGQSYGAIKSDLLDRAENFESTGMESYLCVQRSQKYRRTFDTGMLDSLMSCLESATRKDPTYADAWALLGWLKMDSVRFEVMPPSLAMQKMAEALQATKHAVELDPYSLYALQALASVMYYSGQIDESEKVMSRALALNPNDPDTLVQYGWRLAARGKWDAGIPLVEKGVARTMSPPGWYFHALAMHKYLNGDYQGAIEDAEHSAKNGSEVGLAISAAASGQLGDTAAAQASLARLAQSSPEMMVDPSRVFRTHQVIDPTIEAMIDGLTKAGWRAP